MVKIASHKEEPTAGFKRRLFLAFLFSYNGKIRSIIFPLGKRRKFHGFLERVGRKGFHLFKVTWRLNYRVLKIKTADAIQLYLS